MEINEIQSEDGRHYVQTWIKALGIILGWSEQRTLKWADTWLDYLKDLRPYSSFYNDTPLEYIIPLMIPDRLRKRLPGSEIGHLAELLMSVIQQEDSFCDRDPNFDWKLAGERAQAILKEYGESFPKSEEECKLWGTFS